MAFDAAGLLGVEGPLARVLPSFEPRPQQIRMAREVGAALSSGRTLLIEAGTGIGKSIAYLLPAILWAVRAGPAPADERRVVVSTHTRALQEQLARKDLPLLQRALEELGLEFRHALLMGSENYLCLQRLEELRLSRGEARDTRGDEIVEALRREAKTAVSGLRSELPFAVPPKVWARVRRDRDVCLGPRGPFWEDCLFRRDLARAREAHLLIVNHALFCLDLKTGGRILPPHTVVILDEAHRLEESVSAQLGFSLSDRSMTRLLDELDEAGRVVGRPGGALGNLLAPLRDASATFFETIRLGAIGLDGTAPASRTGDGRSCTVRHRQPGLHADVLRGPLLSIEETLEARSRQAEPQQALALMSLLSRTRDLRERLTAFLEQRIPDSVYWVECDRRHPGATLRAAPIDVAPVLRRQLFEDKRTIVLTSATLAAASSFAHLRRRLGVPAAAEVVLGSPYDYETQALLYLPDLVPDPAAEPDPFALAVTRLCRRLVRASAGGAFVLFTSYSLLRRVHAEMSGDPDLGDLELFVHEAGQASSILERFRMTRKGVLLGTMTFWQGVDVPGDALRLVILTRLPFEPPGHPVAEARAETIRSDGGDPFLDDALPEAILTFRQGFGRLIRSREDRGVIAVLDPRVSTRPYGAAFLESLPACPRSDSLETTERFLRRLS